MQKLEFDLSQIDDSIITNNITFNAILSQAKREFDKKKQKELELENKRIADAKAEKERIEQQRLENIRLKEENMLRDIEIKKQRDIRIENERIASEKLAKIKEKANKEKLRQQGIRNTQDLKAKALQDEINAIAHEKEAKKQLKLSESDSDKIKYMTDKLSEFKDTEFKSKENIDKLKVAKPLLNKIISIFFN